MPKGIPKEKTPKLSGHSLRKSDAQILNAIFRSVREKLKYMETMMRGPKRARRKKRVKKGKHGSKQQVES